MTSTTDNPTVHSPTTSASTRRLLLGGVIAGPLFLVVVAVQSLARDGFDLNRYPLSSLSTGDLGFIQISNFVIAGLLYFGAAIGLRRVLTSGRGRTWGPGLLTVFGVTLAMSGVFVADEGDGFPPGSPPLNGQYSWHFMLHNAFAMTSFLLLIVAGFIFAARFGALRQRGWQIYSALSALAWPVVALWPDPDFEISLRLAVCTAVAMLWASGLYATTRAGLQTRAES
jgi:hypothetical protein